MKTTKPRRVYSTQDTLALCYDGVLYAPKAGTESTFAKGVPATVTEETEDGGITVKQRKPHAKALVETWYPL